MSNSRPEPELGGEDIYEEHTGQSGLEMLVPPALDPGHGLCSLPIPLLFLVLQNSGGGAEPQ